MKTQTLATGTTICTGPSQDIILLYLCLMISVSYWGTVTSLNPFALTPAMSANPYLLQTTPSLSCFASVSLSFSVKPTLSCHNEGKHMRGKTICYIFLGGFLCATCVILFIDGFRPEWSISTIYHGRDKPFWSETLDVYFRIVILTTGIFISLHCKPSVTTVLQAALRYSVFFCIVHSSVLCSIVVLCCHCILLCCSVLQLTFLSHSHDNLS